MDALQKVIENKIRPILQSHNGDIELVEVTADGLVKVRLTGACAACPGAQATINEVVETALRNACPEIKEVIPVAQVDQELIDIALTILRRDRTGHDG
jgi:Fe-S cluster biogenesis protein NfuA